MKLTFPGRRSENLEDYRGASGGRGGGGVPIPIGVGAGLGVPGAIIALILAGVLGGNPFCGGSGAGVNSPVQQVLSTDQEEQASPRNVGPKPGGGGLLSGVWGD